MPKKKPLHQVIFERLEKQLKFIKIYLENIDRRIKNLDRHLIEPNVDVEEE